MAYSKRKNDIAYYKPLSVCKKGTALVGYYNKDTDVWYDVHTKTKPIAWSTRATMGWLDILKHESLNWEEMLSKADGSNGQYLPDYEAVEVIKAYIKCKAPFDDVEFC